MTPFHSGTIQFRSPSESFTILNDVTTTSAVSDPFIAVTQMTFMFLRRVSTLTSVVNCHLLLRVCGFSSRVLGLENQAVQASLNDNKGITSPNYVSRHHLSPWFSDNKAHLEDCKIELVDNESWHVSSGLAEAWRGTAGMVERQAVFTEEDEVVLNNVPPNKEDPDFDEIEDMRVRGNLFYKIDRGSKEFEEYSYDFHRRNSAKKKGDRSERKKNDNLSRNLASPIEKSSKNKDEWKESKKEDVNHSSALRGERLPKVGKESHLTLQFHEVDNSGAGKKQRTPTFNQLTAPYHEPFCLDIYISKASVRACIIHRATSNVVAVAHTISKDMKFDLVSTKNRTACAAVGEVLAQRALADDIHNVVYTPRKGEKLEGKLQIVLQSIIDNGVDVKVKIKQRKFKKAGLLPTA
ncbi:unnamed protein product [Ilex paraguariensis]|uniref:Ribosomal protein L18 n=1 Tax=Ilex paraguariensis TaxID=185542 RepID=A0ABC8S150_9AQUA